MNSNPPSENGAGKSLLVSAPANCLIDSHPVIRDRSSKIKKLLAPNGSRNTLRWINNNVEYKVIKNNKDGKLRYKIFKNGKNLKTRTSSIAKDTLKKIFPFTEEEFYNQIYLDGRRTSTFQMGSPTNRVEFISNVYHVDIFDKLKVLINQKRKELSSYETHYSIKKVDKQDLEKLLLPDRKTKVEEIKALRSDVDKLKQIAVKLQNKLANARFQKLKTRYLKSIVDLAAKLDVKINHNLSESKVKNVLNFLSESKKKLQAGIKLQEDYRQYLLNLSDYKKSKTSIEKSLADIGIKKDFSKQRVLKLLKKWKSSNNKLSSKISVIKKALKDLNLETVDKPLKKDVLQHKSYKKKYGDNVLANMEINKRTLTVNISLLNKSIKLLKNHLEKGHVECEYCGSQLTPKRIKETLNTKQNDLQMHLKKENYLNKAIFKESRYQKTKDNYLAYKNQVFQNQQLEKQLQNLLHSYDRSIDKVAKFEKANQAYIEMSYLKKPISKRKIDLETNLEKDLPVLEKLIGVLNSYLPLASKETTNIDYKSVKRKYNKIQNKLNILQAKLPSLQAKLINDKDLRKRISSIDTDIERWQQQLKDKDLYDFLYAVMPKAKMLTVRHICKEIENNLNNYSNLLFCEPVRFEINVGKGQFDILITRNPGKKEIVSDVKVLSGAESKAFNLLVFLAVLMEQPDSRRANMVIFDEFDANMGENNRKLFINSFIPMINTIIPHVIIVTPNHDEYPNARTFLVKKKGNEAKVLEGVR